MQKNPVSFTVRPNYHITAMFAKESGKNTGVELG